MKAASGVGEPPDNVRSHVALCDGPLSQLPDTLHCSAVAVCHWPQRPCFCGHRRNQTTKSTPDGRKLLSRCACPACRCRHQRGTAACSSCVARDGSKCSSECSSATATRSSVPGQQ